MTLVNKLYKKNSNNNAAFSLDINLLSKMKWRYIHKRFRTPFYTYLLWEGISRHYYQDLSFKYEIPNVLYLDKELMFDIKTWSKTQKLVLSALKKDSNFIINIFDKAYGLNDKIVEEVKNIQRKNFSKLNEHQLAGYLKNYYDLSIQAAAFMIFPLFVESFLEEKITQAVKKIYGPKYLEVMRTITTPAKNSSTQEEEINLLKLAIKKQQGLDISRDVKKHVAGYGWLKNAALEGSFYSILDINKKIKNLGGKKLLDKLKQIRKENRKLINLIQKCKTDIGENEEVVKYIETLQAAIFFRSWRTERFYCNVQYLQDFFLEISKRLKLKKVEELFYLSPIEVIDLLKAGGVANRNVIKDRLAGYVMWSDKINTAIVSGAPVARLKKKIKFLENKKEIAEATPILKGKVSYPGKVTGMAYVVRSKADFKNFPKGAILVSHSTTPDYVPIIKKAVAIITDEGGILSHASVISREMHVPCIIGTLNASSFIKNGDLVEVDAKIGVVNILKRA